MSTKYIVNNVSGQTITGDLTINGNVIITGSSNNNGIANYKALLTQTGPITGTTLEDFNYGLIIGETYTIGFYEFGDDFSNIADVQSGIINTSGCTFIATGQTPSIWNSGTELISNGGLIVDVLENTLGYDIDWQWAPFGPGGYYIGFNDTTGPIYNSFQRDKIDIKIQIKTQFDFTPFGFPPIGIPGVSNFIEKDSVLFIDMYYDGGLIDNSLYYTPVEITVKQDPLTPVVSYGLNVSSFPYGNISIDVFAGENNVETFYGDYASVNNINELVIALNNDTTINYLGTFSVNESVENGIILTTTERIKNQFSPNNTLTFEAFND